MAERHYTDDRRASEQIGATVAGIAAAIVAAPFAGPVGIAECVLREDGEERIISAVVDAASDAGAWVGRFIEENGPGILVSSVLGEIAKDGYQSLTGHSK